MKYSFYFSNLIENHTIIKREWNIRAGLMNDTFLLTILTGLFLYS